MLKFSLANYTEKVSCEPCCIARTTPLLFDRMCQAGDAGILSVGLAEPYGIGTDMHKSVWERMNYSWTSVVVLET